MLNLVIGGICINKQRASIGLVCLLIVLMLSLCSCASSGKSFELCYELEQNKYSRGDSISITIWVENTGGKFKYRGAIANYFTQASLLCVSDTFEYEFSSIDNDTVTADVTVRFVENGERIQYTYQFKVPDDAVFGTYTLKFYVFGVEASFDEIIVVSG